MSRSRKKTNYKKDSGTTPEIRRLTRRRIKNCGTNEVKYNRIVDNWIFNDHVYREFDFKPDVRKIHERYNLERQKIHAGRHPLCIRHGKKTALLKLKKQEKREIFNYLKWLRKK